MAHYGVDVSSNNPHPINWQAMYSYLHGLGGGQPFAIIKINQGAGYVNSDAAADIAAAKAAGFAVGGYMMDQGNTSVASEESLYIAHAEGLPEFDDDELPSGLSTAGYIAHLQVLAANNRPQYLNQSEEDAGYPHGGGVWEANYNGQPGVVHGSGVIIHQYTSSGTVPGVAGIFDLNYFTGTEAQFAALFSGASLAASSTPAKVATTLPNVIAVCPNLKGKGFWIFFTDGSVWSFDGAPFHGSYPGLPAADRAATADFVSASSVAAGGYVLIHRGVTSKGAGIYRFGPQ